VTVKEAAGAHLAYPRERVHDEPSTIEGCLSFRQIPDFADRR
jgi:hypothetical protein